MNLKATLKKRYYCCLTIALCFLAIIGRAQANPLIFNTQDFPPFSFKTGSDVMGPGVDIIRAVCQSASLECNFQLLPWTRAVKEVETGAAHGLFLIGKNDERTTWLDFTPPLIQTEYAFFVANSDSKQYQALTDFDGYSVSVKDASNTLKTLEKNTDKIGTLSIDRRPSDVSSLKKLAGGRVQAVFINSDVGASIIQTENIPARKAFVLKTIQYYVGISKKFVPEPARKTFLNASDQLIKDGSIAKILERYNLTSPE